MDISSASPNTFATIGDYLRFLRRRARLSQRELSIAVGYSESHISRLENNERVVDRASLLALFVPALEIQNEPETIARLLALCAQVQPLPAATPPAPAPSPPTAPTRAANPSHLPAQLTSFIGRSEEISELCAWMAAPQTRLLTLTGAGGCGKTRLALRVGEEMAVRYPHGVWLVELASLTDPRLLAKAVASVFQLRESGEGPLLSTLTEFLHPRHLLLLLDNCEHLIAAVCPLVDALLRACPQLQILATSREILTVSGEQIYRVQPLALPPGLRGGQSSSAGVEGYDAIRLFVERARVVQPGFSLTDRNASSVTRLCQRLDGIPLAIELAAAWANILTPDQIASRLEANLDLLLSNSHSQLPRHKTLTAAIEWSYNLLSPEEQTLLRRLSVFVGGWGVEGAEGVAGELPPLIRTDILGLLQWLVNKSFVVVEHSAQRAARFRLLETIRIYASVKLIAAGEEEQIRDCHLAWFVSQTQTGQIAVLPRAEQSWLAAIEQEEENLRAALDWTQLRQVAGEEMALAVALAPFWCQRGHYSEGRRRLYTALQRNPQPSLLRAQALLWAGMLARLQGEMAAARPLCEESQAIFHDLRDPVGEAQAQENLGWSYSDDDRPQAIRYFQSSLATFRSAGCAGESSRLLTTLAQMAREGSDFDLAQIYLQEALLLVSTIDDAQASAQILNGLAELASLAGKYEQAAHWLSESLVLFATAGSKQELAWTHSALAENCWHRGDLQRGLCHGEKSVQLFRELDTGLGVGVGLAIALHHLGLLWLALHRPAAAAVCLRESLAICQTGKHPLMVARCLAGLAAAAIDEGEEQRAALLLGAAAASLAQRRGLLSPADIEYYQRLEGQVRQKLGEADFAVAWEAGAADGEILRGYADHKSRPLSDPALHLDIPSVRLDDTGDDRQPQSAAGNFRAVFAVGAPPIEALEDVGLHRFVDPRPGVGHP